MRGRGSEAVVHFFINKERYAGWIAFLISRIYQLQDEVLVITLLKSLFISIDYR